MTQDEDAKDRRNKRRREKYQERKLHSGLYSSFSSGYSPFQIFITQICNSNYVEKYLSLILLYYQNLNAENRFTLPQTALSVVLNEHTGLNIYIFLLDIFFMIFN